ncbi:MAG: hypothetical protein RLZZ46_1104 [Bacteroidota bacterium]|jgi:5-(carboxyamino)imidazole ribonucleotide mutase
MNQKKVALLMGSISDWEVMKGAGEMLDIFGVSYHREVLSAHRTPGRMLEFAGNAQAKGFSVLIAGAGGAAHLPGMIASATILPVIGVPVLSSNSIDGWDSVLSILQMPKGVPVATVALNGSANAGLLAIQILALSDERLSLKLKDYKQELEAAVDKMNRQFPL